MRMGAVCPLNLCFTNLTFDTCAALSHPIAQIQCVPICRGSVEEVSVITTICTTLCTSLPALSPVSTSLLPDRLSSHLGRHCFLQTTPSGCLNPVSFASYLISHSPSPQIVWNSLVPYCPFSFCSRDCLSVCLFFSRFVVILLFLHFGNDFSFI